MKKFRILCSNFVDKIAHPYDNVYNFISIKQTYVLQNSSPTLLAKHIL